MTFAAACGVDVVGSTAPAPAPAPGQADAGHPPERPPDGGPAPTEGGAPSDAGEDAPRVVDAGSGTLAVRRETITASVYLNVEGTGDWVHWGYLLSRNERIGGSAIGDYSIEPAGLSREYDNSTSANFRWTGGTPTESHSGTSSYSYLNGRDGIKATLGIAAATTKHTARLYLGAKNSRVLYTFALSDGSAAPWTEEIAQLGDSYLVRFVVDFASPTPAASLVATVSQLERGTADASIRIAAVTLE